MRTANNTNSNYTVENLVAKYRNYVMKHCPKQATFDGDEPILAPLLPDGNADEQLLITIYQEVTGTNANKNIVAALSKYANKFYRDALSDEEYIFLCDHFQDVVSYEFSNRTNWYGIHGEDTPILEERVRLLTESIKPQKGATIFIADAGYGDIAVLFSECIIKGYTGFIRNNEEREEVWALGQIRLFAAGIISEIVPGIVTEPEYNSELSVIKNVANSIVNSKYKYELTGKDSIDYIIYGVRHWHLWDGNPYPNFEKLYDYLKPNGKMFYFSKKIEEMVGKSNKDLLSFRNRIVKEKAISSITVFSDSDNPCGELAVWLKNIYLIINKSTNNVVYIKDEIKHISKEISSELLDGEILLPSYYLTNRPNNGIPLSSLVSMASWEKNYECKDGNYILPDDVYKMYMAIPMNSGKEYKYANLQTQSLSLVSDKRFENFTKAINVINQPCVLLYGNSKDLFVGYLHDNPKGKYATINIFPCLIPNKGIDVRYIAALLFLPEVRQQILTICDGNIHDDFMSLVLDKIIVPNHSEKERNSFLAEANYDALLSSQETLKQEAEYYKKSIRLRKHALTQSLSSIEAMFFALNSYREKHGVLHNEDVISRVKKTTVQEAFEFIAQSLKDMMPALEHIASVEYSFGKSEWIDPEIFIENYIKKNEKGWLNFKPIITWKQGHNLATIDIKDPSSGEIIIRKGESLNLFLFSKEALERVFKNIISNAKAHAFNDKSRNDYQLRFSWHMDGFSLIIEIDNNGSPIPNDRDTDSLLEYGVSTDLHNDGHNGIGCSEIDDIMQRYEGKVKIVSLPNEEFPVKYILTFNRSNNFRTLKL